MKKELSIALLALVLAVFVIRGGSFEKKHPLTFDEIVYPNLAVQLTQAPPTYNTIAIYNDSVKKGRPLPDYFKKPLFKHPPMFPWLISVVYSVTSRSDFVSAFRVSLVSGVLLVVLAYYLARTLFDDKTAVYAALLMSIEPITWISSQKIWMETTLAFFSVLSLYLFAMYVKRDKWFFIIASGIAAGCATLTKYPGILVTGAIVIYALLAERRLFKDKFFIVSLFMPVLMLVPWLTWNFSVYGSEFLGGSKEIAHLVRVANRTMAPHAWLMGIVAVVGAIVWFLRGRIKTIFSDGKIKMISSWAVVSAVIAGLLFLVYVQVLNAFNIGHVPTSGWTIGMFAGEAWYFYPGRLIELSPYYIFSFLAITLFVLDPGKTKDYTLLYLFVLITLGFYMLWGNYQSRYITAVTAPLMILSARFQLDMYERARKAAPEKYRNAIGVFLMLIAAYFAAKTVRVDYLLAIPNSICYF